MALTDTEKLAVFQILGIPTRNRFEVNEEYGDTLLTTYSNARDKINEWLSSLTAAEELEVQNIIAEYDSVKYNTASLKAGKIEDSPERKRSLLRQQLLIILPIRVRDDLDELDLIIG